MIDRAKMMSLAREFGVNLTAEQAEKLDIYAEMLVERNKICNLTAITEPEEIMVRHFLDSFSALPMINAVVGEREYTAIDVGTGAGFPGVVLAAVDNRMSITLLDSSQKRCDFLSDLCEALGIEANVLHLRAEDGAHKPELREQFDIALSRAVAPLNVLAEYCLPFVKVGGAFVAHKGKNFAAEIEAAQNAYAVIGAQLDSCTELTLPDGSERAICVYRKTVSTDAKYPRKPAKIAKQPL